MWVNTGLFVHNLGVALAVFFFQPIPLVNEVEDPGGQCSAGGVAVCM